MTDYYHKHYKEFFDRTAAIDPTSFLSPFINAIPAGISIIDVGCGSGRDLLWLKKQGFDVTGFEQSIGMADLARTHAGCKVIEGDFETYNFSSLSFDAILASGAFVHIPHKHLAVVLKNIKNVFKKKSDAEKYMYISLKEGNGTKTDSQNRTFYLWDDKTLKKLFSAFGFKVIDAAKTESVKNSKDLWIGYVLKLNFS